MSRLPALVGLLRHGPLCREEILAIMGGDGDAALDALQAACEIGLVQQVKGSGRMHYRVNFIPPVGQRMATRRAIEHLLAQPSKERPMEPLNESDDRGACWL